MTTDVDWFEALGREGRIEVAELLGIHRLGTSTRTDPARSFDLAATTVAGRSVELSATGSRRSATVDGALLATIDLTLRPEVEGPSGWSKPLELDGAHFSASVRSDRSRGSRLRGPLRYLHVGGPGHSWVWHFVGGTLAGERLVLARGDEPGGNPVVSTHPAAQGRAMGNPRGGADAHTHRTSWTAAASLGEVVLVELLATARLDGLVDYRGARMAEGFQELVGYVPRVEGNTE